MQKWQKNVMTTLQRRYGVSNASSLDWVKQKKIETTRLHYGVDNPQQCPEIRRRSIKSYTFKNSNSWMSKPEKQFRVILESEFGKENVKVQQLLERKWSVDFYVKSIDTYVSFDGVDWHGLDRQIDVIKNSMKCHDQAIYSKWVKDRELDTYIKDHNLRLIRITDNEFKSNPTACLMKIGSANFV